METQSASASTAYNLRPDNFSLGSADNSTSVHSKLSYGDPKNERRRRMPPQSDVTPGPFGYQFIPENVFTVPAPPPSASPTPSSAHRLLDREELSTVDDFIGNTEIDETYSEADLGVMVEGLPPDLLGWTSTMPIEETLASHNFSMYNDILDASPSYQSQWQSQNCQPINQPHGLYPTYSPLEQASSSNGSNQSINPLTTFSPIAVSSTDRELNSGPIHHNRLPSGMFGSADYTGSRVIDHFIPEAPNSLAPTGLIGAFTNRYQTRIGPLNLAMEQNYQYGNDTRFEANGYVSLSDRGLAGESESNEMGLLKCLVRTDSVTNTPSSSPIMRRPSQHSSVQIPDSQSLTILPSTLEHSVENQDQEYSTSSGSKKRLRDIIDNEDYSQHEKSPPPRRKNRKKGVGRQGPRSTKTSVDLTGPDSDTSLSKKPKFSRGNLSDGQKKANHTKAEQHRRNAIKENLNELIKLVPGLEGQNLNKCLNITRIGDWLQEFAEDNEKIKDKLKKSKGEEAFQKAFKGAPQDSHG